MACNGDFPFIAEVSEEAAARSVDDAVLVQAVHADDSDRTWGDTVNTNNVHELAPPGYVWSDYVRDTDMVAWPLFAAALAGEPDGTTTTAEGVAGTLHAFTGHVEPKAGLSTLQPQHMAWLAEAGGSAVLQRRPPGHMADELDEVAAWVLQAMTAFQATRATTEPVPMFARTDSCSPKDGIPPGAGPYQATPEGARALVNAMASSSRVLSGMRRHSKGSPRLDGAHLNPGDTAEGVAPLLPHHAGFTTPLHQQFPQHCAWCKEEEGELTEHQGVLVLQHWSPFVRPECEFRCFVCAGKVTAVSQYTWFRPFDWLLALDDPHMSALVHAIRDFHSTWLAPRLATSGFLLTSFIMDVVVLPLHSPTGSMEAVLPTAQGAVDWGQASPAAVQPAAFAVRLLELNSFGAHLSSGSALFNWEADLSLLYGLPDATSTVQEGEGGASEGPPDAAGAAGETGVVAHTTALRWLASLKR